MSETKKRGRPPKADKAEPWPVLAMRIRPDVYEQLRTDAEKSGRSISAEAERRVMYREPGAYEVGRLVDIAISKVESRSGSSWKDNKATADQCRYAIDTVANILLGELPAIDRRISNLIFYADRRQELAEGNAGILTQAISSAVPSLTELQSLSAAINASIEAMRDGADTVSEIGIESEA